MSKSDIRRRDGTVLPSGQPANTGRPLDGAIHTAKDVGQRVQQPLFVQQGQLRANLRCRRGHVLLALSRRMLRGGERGGRQSVPGLRLYQRNVRPE